MAQPTPSSLGAWPIIGPVIVGAFLVQGGAVLLGWLLMLGAALWFGVLAAVKASVDARDWADGWRR